MVPTTIALIFVELVGAGTGPLYENLPPASASFVMGDAERTEMDGIKSTNTARSTLAGESNKLPTTHHIVLAAWGLCGPTEIAGSSSGSRSLCMLACAATNNV